MIVLSEKFDQVSFEGEVVPVKQSWRYFRIVVKPIGIDGILQVLTNNLLRSDLVFGLSEC